MTGYANSRYQFFISHRYRISLCIFWLLGISVGCWISQVLKPSFFLLMRSVVCQPVSIVGLFTSIFLPLILSYLSFLCKKPVIILIVCFLKAVAFSFSGVLLSQFFGSASWLLRFLFLFSDNCFMIVLFYLWYQFCGSLEYLGYSNLIMYSVLGLCVAATDYFVISPLLMGLF